MKRHRPLLGPAPTGKARRGAGLLVAGIAAALALTAAGSAAAAPVADPTIVVTPSHKDMVPDSEWTNPIPFTTTKVMPTLDLVFLVDRTGSMSDEIRWVAEALGDIVADLQAEGAADIHFAVTGYDDIDDGNAAYLLELPLGDHTADVVRAALNTLADNVGKDGDGGDEPEDAIYAAASAASGIEWREGSQRQVVLVTDAVTKVRPGTSVAGQPATTDGLAALMNGANVQGSFLSTSGSGNANGTTTLTIEQMAAAVGAQYAHTPTKTALKEAVVATIVDSPTEWTVAHEVSCVYESDGAPSTDLTVTLEPEQIVVQGGESGEFTERAVTKATFDRAGDATVCTVQMTINGVSAGDGARQTVRAIWSPAEIALTILDGDDRAAMTEAEAIDLTDEGAATDLTFTVTNTGTATLQDVHLTDDVTNGVVSDLVCDQDITVEDSGVTLATGEIVTCTGELAELTPDAAANVRGEVVADALDADVATVSATAEYWATVAPTEIPVATPTPTDPAAAPTATPEAGGLASTGASVGIAIAAAVVLVGAGTAIVVLRRRRTA